MSVIEQITAHLTDLGLRSRQIDEDSLTLGFAGKHVSYEVQFVYREPMVHVVALSLLQVPEAALVDALRLANTLNACKLRWGAFWVNPRQHSLCFELGFPAEDAVRMLDVGAAVAALVGAIDLFYPLFARLIWGGDSVEGLLRALGVMNDPDPGTQRFDLAV